MAESKEGQSRRGFTPVVDAESDSPKKKSASKKGSFRVRPGHTVTTQETDDNGDPIQKIYHSGQIVEMDEDTAALMPWCVDTAERRAKGAKGGRPGQKSRLQRKIEELEAQIAGMQKSAATDPRDDENREDAIESLRRRGDNFQARGEPQIGSVPPDVLDAHDRALIAEESGVDLSDLESDDELAGMKGLARGRASDEIVRSPGDLNAPVSIPSQGGPASDADPADEKARKEAEKEAAKHRK